MKIGIMTDIHNNIIALDAILQEFEMKNCEKIICAGDIIGIGPYPEETVQKLMSVRNLIAVRGNHDKYLLEGMPTVYPNDERMDYEEMAHHKWEHSLLSQASVEFLHSLPYRADFFAEGKSACVMHYCMNEEHKYINYTPNPTGEDLIRMFPENNYDIVIYGHDHNRSICSTENRWFINAGSLGCPGKEKDIARAAILEITKDNVSVQSIDIKYDVNKVIEHIDRIKYPSCEDIKKFFYGVG